MESVKGDKPAPALLGAEGAPLVREAVWHGPAWEWSLSTARSGAEGVLDRKKPTPECPGASGDPGQEGTEGS